MTRTKLTYVSAKTLHATDHDLVLVRVDVARMGPMRAWWVSDKDYTPGWIPGQWVPGARFDMPHPLDFSCPVILTERGERFTLPKGESLQTFVPYGHPEEGLIAWQHYAIVTEEPDWAPDNAADVATMQ